MDISICLFILISLLTNQSQICDASRKRFLNETNILMSRMNLCSNMLTVRCINFSEKQLNLSINNCSLAEIKHPRRNKTILPSRTKFPLNSPLFYSPARIISVISVSSTKDHPTESADDAKAEYLAKASSLDGKS